MWDEFQKQAGYRLVHERRAAETAGSGRVLVA